VGTSLKKNRALNHIIAALAEKTKQVTINVQHARQTAAQALQYVVGVCSSIVSLTTGERHSVSQMVGINAQLFQLATLLSHLQTEVHTNAGSSSLPLTSPIGPLMISG
jgi:acid phosphatase family membrane protein YuiD